jgi:hypothetical protein
MSHKCDNCNKIFKRKDHLTYHIKNNACKESNYVCKLCGKKFTTSTSMYRHIRESCIIKKRGDMEKNEIYEKLLEIEKISKERVKRDKCISKLADENKKLKLEVESMKQQFGTKQSITINNGIINNNMINQNILLVGYGKEDISKINKDEMIKILKNGFYSTLKLTEAIHFNPNYPEYQNVYISNIKDKYAMMFDGESWMLTMKEDLINKIYDDKKNYIEENLDHFLDSLTLSRRKALERWLDTEEDNKKIKEIKEQIKLLLYNKRQIPLEKQFLTKTDTEIISNYDKKNSN